MKMGKMLFITGTDTGAGKTLVTGLLGRYLRAHGVNVVTQKWVETGSRGGISQDIRAHDRLIGETYPAMASARSPYVFKAACSPHLAARLEKKRISPGVIKRALADLQARYEYVLIEGAGGILVSLTGTVPAIDIVRQMKIPVLVVVNNKLGAINHSLLTIEALKARRVPVIGIVFNGAAPCDDYIARDNPRIVECFSGERVLGVLPYERDMERLYKRFVPMAKNIAHTLALE